MNFWTTRQINRLLAMQRKTRKLLVVEGALEEARIKHGDETCDRTIMYIHIFNKPKTNLVPIDQGITTFYWHHDNQEWYNVK